MSPHDARRIEKQTIAVAQCMVVTSRGRGWTQETRGYSQLEQTRPTRRVVTLIWSRQAFEVLLIGSGDGSSRISASACERWQKGVGHTTTGLSHSLRALVVLGCGWGAADRPLGSAVRMCERSKKRPTLCCQKLGLHTDTLKCCFQARINEIKLEKS